MGYLGYTHEILVGTTREQAYDRGFQFDLIRGLWTGDFGIGLRFYYGKGKFFELV